MHHLVIPGSSSEDVWKGKEETLGNRNAAQHRYIHIYINGIIFGIYVNVFNKVKWIAIANRSVLLLLIYIYIYSGVLH